jgi:hypothetical protein
MPQFRQASDFSQAIDAGTAFSTPLEPLGQHVQQNKSHDLVLKVEAFSGVFPPFKATQLPKRKKIETPKADPKGNHWFLQELPAFVEVPSSTT